MPSEVSNQFYGPTILDGNEGKRKADISIYGQESNYTTWRLAKMNLAIRGIDGQIAHGDTFHNDRHPDLKADVTSVVELVSEFVQRPLD